MAILQFYFLKNPYKSAFEGSIFHLHVVMVHFIRYLFFIIWILVMFFS